MRVDSPTPAGSGLNMAASGGVRFSFYAPRDVGETIQRRINERMIEVRDEIMGELLADPAVRNVHAHR